MRNISLPIVFIAAAVVLSSCLSSSKPATGAAVDMWSVYNQTFRNAKYVDLSHTISPQIPVWEGFGPPVFGPAMNPLTSKPYNYATEGFESTRIILSSEQLGTHIDAPAHWAPEYPAVDEIPPTFVIRPLVVISIASKAGQNPNYHLRVDDITEWELKNGKIPEGSVVFVRSDWSQTWPAAALARQRYFPGVTLDALKLLHQERKILLHGHEPFDTDSTPGMDAESWLMHNGYAQLEVLANLDKIPEKGALVIIGFPKFQGGTGSYARVIAVCPPEWRYGVSIDEVKESPLPKSDKKLMWDFNLGVRVRK